MGVSVFVFEERVASEGSVPRSWIEREIKRVSKLGQATPELSSPRLQKWLEDMRSSFPLIGDAHSDDANGTDCCYRNVIDVTFATSVGAQGVFRAWQLAEKHGLRVAFGDDVLPRAAPAEENFHLPGLHGQASHVCFIVFDPDLERVSPRDARNWARQRLEAGPSDEEPSILRSKRLKRWMDGFETRKLDALISQMRFSDDLIFIRVSRKNSASMISPIMELSHALDLPFQVYTDID
jgi:hypothetical protein